MSLVKWGFVSLLALPPAELLAFIAVGLAIGWLWTIAACLLTSLIGLLVLTHFGRPAANQFLASLAREGVAAIHLENPGLASLIGGILLLIPGFITDVMAALLFLPPFRRWARARIDGTRAARRGRAHGHNVIDLPPDQWRELPRRERDQDRHHHTRQT
jgi:UPF0716 protein FxsA